MIFSERLLDRERPFHTLNQPPMPPLPPDTSPDRHDDGPDFTPLQKLCLALGAGVLTVVGFGFVRWLMQPAYPTVMPAPVRESGGDFVTDIAMRELKIAKRDLVQMKERVHALRLAHDDRANRNIALEMELSTTMADRERFRQQAEERAGQIEHLVNENNTLADTNDDHMKTIAGMRESLQRRTVERDTFVEIARRNIGHHGPAQGDDPCAQCGVTFDMHSDKGIRNDHNFVQL